jgi:pimeloyl-ACP methyl ester carboxylesterase
MTITLHRRTLFCAVGFSLLSIGLAGATPLTVDERGFVGIGDIDQWIAIQGQDAAKPVILFLHGGPAEAQSPFLDLFQPWETDFTVANWDQRGSGKTFGRNGPSTPGMTVDRMADDAIEVAEHVRRRMGKAKIVLVGQSWGAYLGLQTIRRRPELFSAFVGTGLSVSWKATVEDGERWARQQATAAGDRASLKALDDSANLPLSDLRRLGAIARWRMSPTDLDYLKIQGAFSGPTPPQTGDAADWVAGGAFTIPKLLPAIFDIDIHKLGMDYPLPIFVIQGRDDHVVGFEAARVWLDEIKAPGKAFVAIDGGHFACFTNPKGFVGALRQHVLPVARS